MPTEEEDPDSTEYMAQAGLNLRWPIPGALIGMPNLGLTIQAR